MNEIDHLLRVISVEIIVDVGKVMDYMYVSPQNHYTEAPNPKVMILEGGAFEK